MRIERLNGACDLVSPYYFLIADARWTRSARSMGQTSRDIERDARLSKGDGIEAPTGCQSLGSTRPESGKRQFPTPAERQTLPDIEVRVAIELMMIVRGNLRVA